MVVQHGLGASDYSPVAGLILPRKSNRIKASQRGQQGIRYSAVSEMHRGYPVLKAPVPDGPSRHRFSGAPKSLCRSGLWWTRSCGSKDMPMM